MGVGADGFRGRLKWKRKSKSAWLAALEGMGVRSVFLWKTDLTPDLFRCLTDVSTKVDTHQQPSEPVRGGAVWGGRTVGAMDGAIEPPWVRALCLRSTASQAPERTAASGWAGPRRGVYGVSCQPTPPRHPTDSPLLLLLRLLPLPLRVQGAALPKNPQCSRAATAARNPSWACPDSGA